MRDVKGEGQEAKYQGFFPPRPCQGFENKYFKGSKGSKPLYKRQTIWGPFTWLQILLPA